MGKHFLSPVIASLLVGGLLTLGGWLLSFHTARADPGVLHAAQAASSATRTVTKTADTNDGVCNADCSLREAIAAAAAGDTIVFDPSLSGGTIVLKSSLGRLTLDRDVTIDGGALASPITISGPGASCTTCFGVFFVTSVVTLNRLVIANGQAGQGGGINNVGTLTVTNSTFSNNDAYQGGGIWNIGPLTILNSLFSDNGADSEGGGIYNGGTVSLANSAFTGNTSTGSGGGITNNGMLSMTNSTFADNRAGTEGGGIWNLNQFEATNSTFAGNSAVTNGGGILNYNMATLRNSIIADNAGGNCSGAPLTDGGNNLDDGATCGFDPSYGSLNNTDPQLDTFSGAYYPLLATSPAIDAVIYNAPNDCPATDQRGQTRNDLACDIGAFELKLADSDTVTKTIAATGGNFTFGPTMIRIVVTGPTTCLTGLTVQRYDVNHPNATLPLQTGHWWDITPTGCTSGFDATLTLPTDFTPDNQDKVCYHVSGTTWDCDMSSFTASSITRDDITTFSAWAAGDNADPTAVTLRRLTARSPLGFAVVLGTVLAILAGAWRLASVSRQCP